MATVEREDGKPRPILHLGDYMLALNYVRAILAIKLVTLSEHDQKFDRLYDLEEKLNELATWIALEA